MVHNMHAYICFSIAISWCVFIGLYSLCYGKVTLYVYSYYTIYIYVTVQQGVHRTPTHAENCRTYSWAGCILWSSYDNEPKRKRKKSFLINRCVRRAMSASRQDGYMFDIRVTQKRRKWWWDDAVLVNIFHSQWCATPWVEFESHVYFMFQFFVIWNISEYCGKVAYNYIFRMV